MARKLFFYSAMLAFMLLLLEAFAFVAVQLVDRDDLFDTREAVLDRLTEEGLTEFRERSGDPLIGWRNYGPVVREEDNCLGQPVSYSYDDVGARIHRGFDVARTRIIMVGDSYTRGDEIADDETFAAGLSGLLGVSVANHGMGGYGPTQALLNLEAVAGRYPEARVAVLGIMYENLYRMVNSYRPVLYDKSSNFTLKPYMKGGDIVPHPGAQALASLEQFKVEANRAFDNDFWARPEPGFPYIVSLVRSFTGNAFYFRKLQREFRKVGKPEYFLAFESPQITKNLVALLNRFASSARDMNLTPVVVFIPRNRLDVSSATEFLNRHRSDLDSQLIVGDVAAQEGIDWVRFNLQEPGSDNICHPSPYGAEVIAAYIAQLLRDEGAWPAR